VRARPCARYCSSEAVSQNPDNVPRTGQFRRGRKRRSVGGERHHVVDRQLDDIGCHQRASWTGPRALLKISVGENTVVGAGAVVTQDVPARCLAVSNPARIARRDIGGSTIVDFSRLPEVASLFEPIPDSPKLSTVLGTRLEPFFSRRRLTAQQRPSGRSCGSRTKISVRPSRGVP
jgi:hypothetical protein